MFSKFIRVGVGRSTLTALKNIQVVIDHEQNTLPVGAQQKASEDIKRLIYHAERDVKQAKGFI